MNLKKVTGNSLALAALLSFGTVIIAPTSYGAVKEREKVVSKKTKLDEKDREKLSSVDEKLGSLDRELKIVKEFQKQSGTQITPAQANKLRQLSAKVTALSTLNAKSPIKDKETLESREKAIGEIDRERAKLIEEIKEQNGEKWKTFELVSAPIVNAGQTAGFKTGSQTPVVTSGDHGSSATGNAVVLTNDRTVDTRRAQLANQVEDFRGFLKSNPSVGAKIPSAIVQDLLLAADPSKHAEPMEPAKYKQLVNLVKDITKLPEGESKSLLQSLVRSAAEEDGINEGDVGKIEQMAKEKPVDIKSLRGLVTAVEKRKEILKDAYKQVLKENEQQISQIKNDLAAARKAGNTTEVKRLEALLAKKYAEFKKAAHEIAQIKFYDWLTKERGLSEKDAANICVVCFTSGCVNAKQISNDARQAARREAEHAAAGN